MRDNASVYNRIRDAPNFGSCSTMARKFKLMIKSLMRGRATKSGFRAGARHRLGSSGGTVRVLEVAFGNWQQEDIRRYEDDYDRPAEGE